MAVVACAASALALGCSGDGARPARAGAGGSDSGTGTGGTGAGGGSTGSSVSFDGTKFIASITARNVVPGDQQHVCVDLVLPNADQVWIADMHATLSPGSHHLIVDRAPGATSQPDPQVCFPTMGSDATRLIIAQQPDTRITLPAGVALPLAPRQPLFLQLHYANTDTVTRDITGTVELTVASASPTPIEAKSIFTGSYSISLPPNSPGSATSFYTPVPSVGTRHVFALTSHTHKLGVRATIERVPSATAPATTPLHESLSWSEPPLTLLAPPLAFDGTDGLRLTCYYQNTTSQFVSFGTNVENEMCFMWVYYYDQ